jgi:hypothetical protein
MRAIYRVLVRLGIVLGLLSAAALVVAIIVNHDAVLGTGDYARAPSGFQRDKDGNYVYVPPSERPQTKTDFEEARLKVILDASILPCVLCVAALGVFALAWIVKPENAGIPKAT